MTKRETIARRVTSDGMKDYGLIMMSEGDKSHSKDSRPGASVSIEIVYAPAGADVIEVCELERHPSSAQAFFPLEGAAYVVIVCRSTPDDQPDLNDLKAFVVPGNIIVQYHAGIWHAPIRMFGQASKLGMVVHKAERPDDCEFVSVPSFKVKLPQKKASAHSAGIRAAVDFCGSPK